MKGFFSKTEIIGQTDNCQRCGLHKGCQSPRMGYTGQGEKGVLIIAEAPGKTEDEKGIQLVGQAGELLRRHLSNLGLDLDRDFWKINTVNCRPPGNRKPSATEIKLCKPRVIEAIKKLNPKFIWLMGSVALESFYMGDFDDTSITPWRKRCIPDYDFRAWIMPLYHPSFILRNKDEKLTATFRRDLEWAVSCLSKDRVRSSSTSDVDTQYDSFIRSVHPLYDANEIKNILKFKNQSFISFDYETSGLNPYKGNPKIPFVSVSNGDSAYAFRITDEIVPDWKRFLTNADIKKIAHNLKFEDKWSRVVFGVKPRGWHWDTMVSQHVLDGRKRTTGLKFQAYVRYGIKGYDKEIEKYKKDWTKAPVDKALLYCGMDSLLTFNLFVDQIKEFDENPYVQSGNDLFFKGNLALADVENNGICVNTQHYLDENQNLDLQIRVIEKGLMNSGEARLFKNKFNKTIDLGSAKDLRGLFYDIKKITPPKQTVKGQDSVDHSVLVDINTEFSNKLLELRKLNKIKDTYLSQFLRETCDDGKLHPSFNLNMVVTYRSCIAKGTKILAVKDFIKYPDGVPIEEIKAGDFVYCFDDNLKPVIRKVLWAGKTGHRKVIRLHWGTRGHKGYVDVTPEHLLRHISGEYIRADEFIKKSKEISFGKLRSYRPSVLSIRRIEDELFCTGNINKSNRGLLEHRFIYENLIGNLKKDEVVHHKGIDHLNHELSNLEKCTRKEHSLYHSQFIPKDKQRLGLERAWENSRNGIYKPKKGFENSNSLRLSKFACLRILSDSGGKWSKIKFDFTTFKIYLRYHKIDYKLVKLRYDKNGKYISKKRLIELSKQGIHVCVVTLGHNYYKLKKLYDLYGIPFERKWGNQFGSFVPNNHKILRMEILDKKVDVYDLEVEEFNNFIANEICVHNSSDKPNFQNIPVRDENAKLVTRAGIIPTKGNQLLEVDYSALEVKVIGCVSKDKVLIDYIKSGADPHKDEAKNLFLFDNDEWDSLEKDNAKEIRFYAKNQKVFPYFYGSFYKGCAGNVWPLIDQLKVKKHLRNKGIKSYYDFEEHCRVDENRFWNKFIGVKEWQNQTEEFYLENGYIEYVTGFRSDGYLTRNDLFNWPIQGPAFHCLLWSLIELNRELKKYQTKIIGQIHDSIVFDMYPPEKKMVINLCKGIMTKRIKRRMPWIIVPLEVEFEMTEIDQAWYYKKEVKNGPEICK